MNAAEGMNLIAEAVAQAFGNATGFLPLSVRYGAAEAAAKFVSDWMVETGKIDPTFAAKPGWERTIEAAQGIDKAHPREA